MAEKQENYIIVREYLGKCSVNQLLENIIQKHIKFNEKKEVCSVKNDVEKSS